ncbi:serine/threonine-protein kinase PknK [Crenobacter cavernae]|uniref:Serine/threonine-protein kinase PknK n=1 Tax=Crenobacter cavernae TaxID=2290923 RepID=A0A345Y846_9NEIS|nr:serine/threonine-protein kinase PknK [Crenobacter cavernae]
MMTLPGFTLVETLYDSPGTAVYRARADDDSTRSLILKTPKAAFLRQEELTRYRREYDVLGRLELPHVIRAHELKMIGKRPVLVLEDVGGRSLAQQLPGAGWTLAERLEIAISITEGVAELHAARVIHKHLTPANIVFDPASRELRLIDFGIATHLTRESPAVSHPDTLEGTLAYLSPEQTGRMNRTLDYRSDFYSLGVTLYELFTGTLPFTSDDTLALIHKHLTLPPEPAHERNPGLPAVLSDILARLMAKTADARYQSAEGIRHDLATLLEALRSDGKAPRFALGRQDVPSHFQLSQKLYGRTEETAQLLAAFERASRGAHELMLVAGYSGIGKSCLVHELFKPLTRQRGYFIGGKFDQFQKNIPYSALVSACRELVRQLLTENAARLGHWRSELAAALGASGQVIVDVIPEVELIIGRQEPVPALAPLETQNRFNLVFQGFLRVFYRPDHPLVIFLDDLQWADSATLALLSVLMTDRDARYLLIVGAYRDNEVGADHPLWSLRDGLIRQEASVAYVELAPMALDAITEMVADTLFCDADTARPLARLVKEKTGGNPFFAGQFLSTLYEEGLITFGGGSHGEADAAVRWRWDMARIARANITDNVVELMVGKLRKLPAEAVEVLKLAACLGNRFDLDSLAIVYARPLGPTFVALKAAVGEGLVIPTSALEMLGADAGAPLVFARYQFLHDRVQQAAYALVDGDVKQALHLRIGRLLLESVSVSALGDRLFEIVDHLNRGRDGITLRSERLRLAGLNLEAAKKAKSSAAYSAALGYLTCAFSVFDGDWRDDYALSLALSREGADLEYLNGNYGRAEALIQQIWQNSTSVQERVAAYSQLVTQRTMLGKNEEAVVAAGQALQLLGMGFPAEADLQSALDAERLAIEQGLAGRSIADLIALPPMSDPTIRSAMQVLMTVHTTAYFANYYTLYCWVLARMTRLSMEYGNVPESAKGYASFGNTLAAHWGRYEDGYEFGMLGAALADRYAHQGLKCKTRLILSMFLNHWTRPLAEAERFDEEGQRAGMEAGEFQFIGYILVHGRTLNRLFAGAPLAPLRSEIDPHLVFTRKVKHNLSTDYLVGVQRLIAALADEAPDAQGLAEADEEARYLDTCAQNRSFAALCSYHTLKAFVHYLLGDMDAAYAAIEAAEPLLGYVKGTMTEPEHAHYLALILLARETTPGTLARAEACLERLRQWAVHGSANFTHKALLVEAELACATGRIADALEGYDQAIAAAGADGFLHYEALANERAARFWLARGKPEFARPYLHRALDGYRAWGAERKRAGLAAAFPEQGVESLSGGAPRAATAGRLGDLDLASVLKTSQAISGEIVLDRCCVRPSCSAASCPGCST